MLAVATDRVDGMSPQGVGVESIEVLHHCQLVRNGDVRPGRIWRTQLLDRIGQRVRRNVKEVVCPVEARGAERRGLHRRAARVRESGAEKVDPQGITRLAPPRGRGGWAWPSHDFVSCTASVVLCSRKESRGSE